jgi:hypothetical protein
VAKPKIEAGDRFTKIDTSKIVWTVDHLVDKPDQHPSALLVREDRPRIQISLSLSALNDPILYKKLAA